MKKIVFAAIAAIMVSSNVFADKVLLKSGSYLTGKAAEIAGDSIVFESEDLGSIKIKIANIKELESDNLHVVRYKDYSTEQMPLSIKEGKLEKKDGPLDMAGVKDIDAAIEKWHGSVNVGYTSKRGNTYDNTATLVANVNRKWEHDRFKADFGYYYSETGTRHDDKQKTQDRWEIEGQHDHFWQSILYTYERARYEQDDIAGVDSRLRLGVGVGLQWLDGVDFDLTGKWSFSQEIGASWIKTDYRDRDPSADDTYATFRYAHHLNYNPKWNLGVNGFHNLEFLPQVDDWENYLIKADVGFTTKLIMDFNLLAKIEWDYNSMPSVGRKSSDIRYILGLGYAW